MSRPKSPERIQADLDKAIRKERRERKKAEREARRKERDRKRATHESVERNGVPKVESGGERLGLHNAAVYSPCDGCYRIVGNVEIVSHFCGTCEHGERRTA